MPSMAEPGVGFGVGFGVGVGVGVGGGAGTAGTSTAIIPLPPVTIETIEYDFEEYALSHGIPETLDPLPYRKAGSVFATGEEAEPQLTSAKNDPRLRTVVCRHWLRDLCMKGAACEFLHQYDLGKMPLCRHGDRCKVRDCPFRHISEADRLECVFYSQGFCIHGPFCRYKHVRRDRADLPLVADFTLGLSQMQAGRDGSVPRRPAPKPNEFYKVSLCKHYLNGECPFGDGCHFAHGEGELRKFPTKRGGGPGGAGAGDDASVDGNGSVTNGGGGGPELSDNMFGTHETTTMDYYQGGSAGGGRPSPILEPERSYFFILRAATQDDLAISTVRSEWYVQRRHAERINTAYRAGGGRQVMLFFTVSDSDHIQGAALMTSMATYREEADDKQSSNPSSSTSSSSSSIPPSARAKARTRTKIEESTFSTSASADDNATVDAAADREGPFCYRLRCEWYRTVELPIGTAVEAAPDLLLPTRTTQYCQDMTSQTGEAVMKAIWNSPLVTLYENWTGDYDEYEYVDDDDGHDVHDGGGGDGDGRRGGGRGQTRKRKKRRRSRDGPPADDALLTDFRCPGEDEIAWPTMPGPGFIFGCNSQTMDECLGRGILGLPSHMKATSSRIRPGSSIFLYNVTDRLLFGIFEAITPALMNIEPTAFSKNPKATTSPFPVQIRVRVSLECPPVEDSDPILNDILRTRVGGRIGPVTHAQASALASLLASQCGALQYMIEYDRAVKAGRVDVVAPPIALPPRKIGKAGGGGGGGGGGGAAGVGVGVGVGVGGGGYVGMEVG